MRYNRPSLRALAAVAVLTAWAGSLAWLGLRSVGQSEGATLANEASLRLSPTAAWFAVYSGDEQIGSAGITLDTLSPGYQIRETVTLELPSGGASLRATRLTQTRLGANLLVQQVRTRIASGTQQVEWNLRASGDTVTVRRDAAGLQFSAWIATPSPPLTLGALPYRLALTGSLGARRSRQLLLYGGWPPAVRATEIQFGHDSMVVFADSSAIDPSTGLLAAAHRDSALATEVRLDSPVGPYRVWVDRRGGVTGIDWPLGTHWVRSDFDLAVREFRRKAPTRSESIQAALGTLSPLALPGALTDTSGTERRYRIERRDGRRISGALLVYLTGGRQTMQSGVLRVRSLPARVARLRVADQSFDPLAQAEAPEIRALATRFLQGATGGDALNRLATAIPLLATIDTSAMAAEDALGTLTSRRGRPDGIARLFVAIARAGGMQARYVVGVLPRGDRILTHAWAEVWDAASNNWLAVDPVFGRSVAGTGFVRLGLSGSSHPDELRPMLAQAKFTPLLPTEAP